MPRGPTPPGGRSAGSARPARTMPRAQGRRRALDGTRRANERRTHPRSSRRANASTAAENTRRSADTRRARFLASRPDTVPAHATTRRPRHNAPRTRRAPLQAARTDTRSWAAGHVRAMPNTVQPAPWPQRETPPRGPAGLRSAGRVRNAGPGWPIASHPRVPPRSTPLVHLAPPIAPLEGPPWTSRVPAGPDAPTRGTPVLVAAHRSPAVSVRHGSILRLSEARTYPVDVSLGEEHGPSRGHAGSGPARERPSEATWPRVVVREARGKTMGVSFDDCQARRCLLKRDTERGRRRPSNRSGWHLAPHSAVRLTPSACLGGRRSGVRTAIGVGAGAGTIRSR